MSIQEARDEYTELLPHLYDFRQRLLSEFSQLHDPGIVQILTRIKAWESISDKLARTGGFRVGDLADLVGVRIIVKDVQTAWRITDDLETKYLITERTVQHLRSDQSATHLFVNFAGSSRPNLRAEIQILTQAEEARRAIQHVEAYKVTDRQEGTSGIEAVIDAFELLIALPGIHEKQDVHPFLTTNSFLLYPHPDTIISEVPIGLGTEYRIDFMIRRADGTYILVELENPLAPLVTKAGDFSATVNHAICQVEDWQEWIEANLSLVEKHFPGMRAPEAWVVVGRDRELSEAGHRRIARRNVNMRGRVTIRTYDDLIRDARAFVRSIKNALVGQP